MKLLKKEKFDYPPSSERSHDEIKRSSPPSSLRRGLGGGELLPNLKTLQSKRKQLRNNSTPAEQLLWKFLHKRYFLGLKFRRQHSVGNYILDFYCPEIRLAIELDGYSHSLKEQFQYDEERTHKLKEEGIRVMRFSNEEVLKHVEGVLSVLEKSILDHPLAPSSLRRGDKQHPEQCLSSDRKHDKQTPEQCPSSDQKHDKENPKKQYLSSEQKEHNQSSKKKSTPPLS